MARRLSDGGLLLRVWKWAPCLVLCAAAIWLAIRQPYNAGFSSESQHGWVSAHSLAILSKATWDHGFLGFALQLQDADGANSYEYFDRYPVLFGALGNFLIDWDGVRLATQIMIARQLFNAIYFATLVLSYRLVCLLTGQRWTALAAAFFAMSGHYLLTSKDMIHYDQPALLGVMLLLVALAELKLRRRRRLFYVCVGAAVLLGRGYAAFSVLGVWGAFEAAALWRRPSGSAKQTVARFLRSDVVKACALALCLSSVSLAYNVYREARITGCSMVETGIVRSAKRRLSLDQRFNKGHRAKLAWPVFLRDQAQRVVTGFAPPYQVGQRRVPTWPLWPAFAVAGISLYREPLGRRRALRGIALLCGFVWCLGMRNLTAFHSYTAMYYLPFWLCVYLALIEGFPRRWRGFTLVPAVLVFAWSVASLDRVSKQQERANERTQDFERMLPQLDDTEPIYVAGGYRKLLRHVPFGLGFYLRDHPIALHDAELAVSREKKHGEWRVNLTPNNRHVFLLKR